MIRLNRLSLVDNAELNHRVASKTAQTRIKMLRRLWTVLTKGSAMRKCLSHQWRKDGLTRVRAKLNRLGVP
jgi:hypothetical protein